MLADFHELARAALNSAIEDQKLGHERRILDRAAFLSAAETARERIPGAETELHTQLDTAIETLKQEQHDDEQGSETLARSIQAALAKLAELENH
jgi:hypothetical protein